jgi:hypothetical protein
VGNQTRPRVDWVLQELSRPHPAGRRRRMRRRRWRRRGTRRRG